MSTRPEIRDWNMIFLWMSTIKIVSRCWTFLMDILDCQKFTLSEMTWIMFFRLGWTTLTIIWPGCLLQGGVLQIYRIVDVLSHTKGRKWVKVSQSESKWVKASQSQSKSKVTGLVSDLFAPFEFYQCTDSSDLRGPYGESSHARCPSRGVVLLWGWIFFS